MTAEVLNFFENRWNIAGKIPRNTENKKRWRRHNDVKYVSILLETSFNIKSMMSFIK
jgi:hypothetical protein